MQRPQLVAEEEEEDLFDSSALLMMFCVTSFAVPHEMRQPKILCCMATQPRLHPTVRRRMRFFVTTVTTPRASWPPAARRAALATMCRRMHLIF
jgi:hypothetical protein